MKKLVLFISGVCLLSSFAVASGEATVNAGAGCPKCAATFKEKSMGAAKIYAGMVEKAADELKAKLISREQFDDASRDAGRTLDKAEAEYQSEFNTCCLKEMKEAREKEEQ